MIIKHKRKQEILRNSTSFPLVVYFFTKLALVVGHNDMTAPTRELRSWTSNEDSWTSWWSYSGPSYWGPLNENWLVCDKGRRQSPLNIETSALVYDPNLVPLVADNNLISGILYNDGRSIVFNSSLAATIKYIKLNSEQHVSLDNSLNDQRKQTVDGVQMNVSRRRDVQMNHKERDAHAEYEQKNVISTFTKQVVSESLENDPNSLMSNDDLLHASVTLTRFKRNLIVDDNNDDDDANSNQMINELVDLDDEQRTTSVHFTGAGLDYSYKFEALHIKFGTSTSSIGSEHQLNGRSFAAELQLYSYNNHLYKSYNEAVSKPRGLLAISILVDTLPPHLNDDSKQQKLTPTKHDNNHQKWQQTPSEQLTNLLARLSAINYRGAFTQVHNVNLTALLAISMDQFVSYEGSLTQPACDETVTWLILNRPLYITQASLDALRSVSADERDANGTGNLIAGNLRPIQPTNNRTLRTNIKPSNEFTLAKESCPRLWTRYEYKHGQESSA